jgi:hypothetical protein
VLEDSLARTEFSVLSDGGDAVKEVVKLLLENEAYPGPVGSKIVATFWIGEDRYSMELLPEHPVANAKEDAAYDGDLTIRMALISDSLVAVTINRADVKGILTESIAIIDDAQVRPYPSDASEAQIEVVIRNMGSVPTDYIVGVKECSANIEAGVPVQIALLEPDADIRHELIFDVRTDSGFSAGDHCSVWVTSPTGSVYDSTLIYFPDPS